MQQHRGSLGAPGPSERGRERRHSACDILLRVLQRTRGSAADCRRVMGALSEERIPDESTARVPTAKYTKMGETLRHVIPGHMQCSMACGGRACKYENPSRWSDEEQAVKGLYSSWITDNLLAMARPSTEIIEKYNIIEQFRRCGLKTVINLQRPGEHASCGNPLEQESGFTYRPEIFMEAGIYYYNFGWKDYGVASLTTILDMVKVMSFAVQEGKMAIHCHAGLGRTGVLVACYLVFTSRMSADQAILFVRAKRPNSIQTRGQLLCVREFAQFLIPLRSVFSCTEPKTTSVTLSQYLTRQRHLLHGYEARQLKHVPKIIQLVCQLLTDIANNRQAEIEEQWLEIPDLTAEVEKTVSQQALQQLGNEMRGKGIPVSPCLSQLPNPGLVQPLNDLSLISDSELDWNIPISLSLSTHKSLSYSDSVLHKLNCDELCLESVHKRVPLTFLLHHSLSHSSLIPCNQPNFSDLSCKNFTSKLQMPEMQVQKHTQSPFLKKRLQKGHQSLSLDLSEPLRNFYSYYTNPASAVRTEGAGSEQHSHVVVERRESEDVSLISLPPELSPDNRRLLVAKALALDHVDPDLKSKVSVWQTELNSREGAWERLCLEREPLVLSALMWSWLEQLKEPVISREDVKALSESNVNSQEALDSLQKGHRQTLLCILECAANLLPLPEDVESKFLTRTIKVFTRIDPDSDTNKGFYSTLKSILTSILHDVCDKATKDNEDH
ncbi:protein tyrosine phosphatase domain-containing protein 1 isoform X1 [Periophthalmus magnuspinnatus]|uniref:protein tyrosine phosphatase domain-containing protein 1 isoform X1 n=1 Tax=Periophthalmus magnuspinnatus TaxID=409849 RepID=UPI002436681F|nr:protein tyrosine phosphatase domain-containing protein 1 isoform X1 [Periophthalmus magnuspinnatus]